MEAIQAHDKENSMKHEMVFEFTKSDGAEEWFCEICGRRILLNVPVYGMVVIDNGDKNAIHYGSTGGLRVVSIGVQQDEK